MFQAQFWVVRRQQPPKQTKCLAFVEIVFLVTGIRTPSLEVFCAGALGRLGDKLQHSCIAEVRGSGETGCKARSSLTGRACPREVGSPWVVWSRRVA